MEDVFLIKNIKKVLFFFLLYSNFSFAQKNIEYNRVYLSGKDSESTIDWDFKISDGNENEWSTIAVPSNWELEGFGKYNYGRDYLKKNVIIGKEQGLYRHRFNVPEGWKEKVVNIVFDGVMTDAEVSLNGKSAGEIHQGAFYRFKYDITDLLNFGGENLLEVKVSKHSSNESVNKAEREADFWIFGGIFRPVFLEILPDQHITRAAIHADHQGRFKSLVQINKPIKNGSVRVTIRSANGNLVGEPIEMPLTKKDSTLILTGTFNNIESWNPEWPTLYKADYELLQDDKAIYRKEESFGFRTVELRVKDGIYINDTKVVFKGVNRHSFWPETGRALSEENHLLDIRLMKEMNMNAVRMSHYPPDERFLELSDSLGLFVLDELTGWQSGYDTIVGAKLVKELILKDENHPSVVMWAHGNEGGWNFANEKWFDEYDIQGRPVYYPWLLRNGIDTRHYPDYQYGINRLSKGDEVFMPTEFLHGVYDGGHGAALDDYWNNYRKNPTSAGGFLWAFSDEAVVRRDQNNKLDADGDNGPDGIVGPYREKEGSFYAIKEIWSPVQILPAVVRSDFKGLLKVSNDYFFTNLNQCIFSWKTISITKSFTSEIIDSGTAKSPDIEPGGSGLLKIKIPANFSEADIFSLTATDPKGMEIYTWTWPIKAPYEITEKLLSPLQNGLEKQIVNFTVNEKFIDVEVGELSFQFGKEDGLLKKVDRAGTKVPLGEGPTLVGLKNNVGGQVTWDKNADGSFLLQIKKQNSPENIIWNVTPSGLLRLEMSPFNIKKDSLSFLGVSFNYPEERIKGITWMGQGPYRVWKNRTQGAEIGVWQKDYNNTVTGESFESLIYPEFKGYHGKFFWAELETTDFPFRVLTETPGLFFRLLTPDNPQKNPGGVIPPFPEGDLSFLVEIPAIGTKFKKPEKLGPSSQKGNINFHEGDQITPIILWFDFNIE